MSLRIWRCREGSFFTAEARRRADRSMMLSRARHVAAWMKRAMSGVNEVGVFQLERELGEGGGAGEEEVEDPEEEEAGEGGEGDGKPGFLEAEVAGVGEGQAVGGEEDGDMPGPKSAGEGPVGKIGTDGERRQARVEVGPNV